VPGLSREPLASASSAWAPLAFLLAPLFAEEGFPVTGFDIDSTKVDMLASSRSYICRMPETEIALARDRGFQAATDLTFVSEMDVIVICVPTAPD
jgi:UDP-N-acetyl-D-glucosamine dehydrogenase